MRRAEPRDPFAIVYRSTLATDAVKGLTKRAMHVWLVLLSFVAPGSEWQLSLSKIIEITGYSRADVKRAIRRLEDAGLVVREKQTRKNGSQAANSYTMVDLRSDDEPDSMGGGQIDSPPRGQIDPPPPESNQPPPGGVRLTPPYPDTHSSIPDTGSAPDLFGGSWNALAREYLGTLEEHGAGRYGAGLHRFTTDFLSWLAESGHDWPSGSIDAGLDMEMVRRVCHGHGVAIAK